LIFLKAPVGRGLRQEEYSLRHSDRNCGGAEPNETHPQSDCDFCADPRTRKQRPLERQGASTAAAVALQIVKTNFLKNDANSSTAFTPSTSLPGAGERLPLAGNGQKA
jgi:hypothetical protein